MSDRLGHPSPPRGEGGVRGRPSRAAQGSTLTLPSPWKGEGCGSRGRLPNTVPLARTVLSALLVVGFLVSSAALGQDVPRAGPAPARPLPGPTTAQKQRAAASFLGALIVLLLLFAAFVSVMVVLRHRLLPRRRAPKRRPTDASDLWSLPGQEAARRKIRGKEPGDRPS